MDFPYTIGTGVEMDFDMIRLVVEGSPHLRSFVSILTDGQTQEDVDQQLTMMCSLFEVGEPTGMFSNICWFARRGRMSLRNVGEAKIWGDALALGTFAGYDEEKWREYHFNPEHMLAMCYCYVLFAEHERRKAL